MIPNILKTSSAALFAASLLCTSAAQGQTVRETTVVAPAPAPTVTETTVSTPAPAPAVQETTTTTTTQGTLGEFGTQSITLTPSAGSAPVRYSSSQTTTYVDETGAPVEVSTLKQGVPVTVHYSRVGESLVAQKVIVRQSRTVTTPAPAPVVEETKKTTTTTTTAPVPVQTKKDDDDDDD